MKKTTIMPRGKYILIRPDALEASENEFGLLVPENEEKETKAQGEVLAVSPEITDVKKGDKVIYGAFAGETIKTREEGKEQEYKLLHNDDVIAFIR